MLEALVVVTLMAFGVVGVKAANDGTSHGTGKVKPSATRKVDCGGHSAAQLRELRELQALEVPQLMRETPREPAAGDSAVQVGDVPIMPGGER